MSRSTSNLDSPRISPMKDRDAFNFDPAHLQAWLLPQDVWDSLPPALKSSVTDVQHSAAAVLTSFARLDNHSQDQDQDHQELPHLDLLPEPRFRTISNASSVFSSDSSCATTTSSSASQSGSGSPVTTPFSSSQSRPPFSPASLGDPAKPSEKRDRSRDRSFSTPLEPNDAYYVTELSHLRTESLVHLRHLSRDVDRHLADIKGKRSIGFSGDDAEAIVEHANDFENWWAEKTLEITSLSCKAKRLADTLGLVPTGLGWCAP